MVDEKSRDKRRTGHAHISEYPVNGKRDTRILTTLDNKRKTDRMVYGCEKTDAENTYADLDRRFQLCGELGIAVEIVVDDRLFDPVEAKIVDGVAALQRFAQMQTLVEVDHQP